MLISDLKSNKAKGYKNYLTTENTKQAERLNAIFNDLLSKEHRTSEGLIDHIKINLHEGFIDHDLKIACYTDHQVFERYHRFNLKETRYKTSESLTLKEILSLNPGDFVTHIDHGIGRFGGLVKITTNGIQQEAVKLVYKDNDFLYVSIHSLHRISKYTGKEGNVPRIDKIGSTTWSTLKQKTKKNVKEVAYDLIKLYAKRKTQEGHRFPQDNYLQHELEASFIYEDTPDQIKVTTEVKRDMEKPHPMDRLVCGDVGFGKTEIAVRAAFKAVCDSKQVAILVPTTILAYQHFKTFKERQIERTDELDVSLKTVQTNYTEVKVEISREINPQISPVGVRTENGLMLPYKTEVWWNHSWYLFPGRIGLGFKKNKIYGSVIKKNLFFNSLPCFRVFSHIFTGD